MGEIETATRKLTGRLSEAATGSGAAVKALGRLNLSAGDLQRLPLDERLIAIQDWNVTAGCRSAVAFKAPWVAAPQPTR